MQSDTGTDVRQATWRQREQFPGPFEIPYLGQAGPRTRERAFLTKGHDLGELSGFVTDLWEAYSWKWIESRLSFRELYRLHWGPGTHSPTTVTPWYFGAAALADDLAFIGETLVDLHSLASEWADKAQEEGIDLASLEVGSPRSEHRAHVTDNLLQAYARAKLARAILRALQIDVTPPHMDFSAFDQYVKRNYGPSAPFLRY
ncbi:hypothetical protein [Minwuia thermotolerans]|uniref:Uncharacterized protein n=1 Tax=Minwuia thermotolerans TaxID=2056226 RepID=A0A2M9G545_9PROT|nr:hypothetical protein [Minwuia thermotolerans]PJK30824.1 hypothetical protein CVT23_05525 [Minwuia thermotolerans]